MIYLKIFIYASKFHSYQVEDAESFLTDERLLSYKGKKLGCRSRRVHDVQEAEMKNVKS